LSKADADSKALEQQALENLKRAGAGVNSESFGVQVFLSQKPSAALWEWLSQVPHLRRLYLLGDWVTDAELRQVARLSSVELLYLSAPHVGDEGLALITQLPNLEFLTLRKLTITDDGLAQLSRATRLTSLELIGCPRITGAGLQYLENLPLTELFLEGRGLRDAGLAHLAQLPRLHRIEIRSEQISDLAAEHLKALRTLKKPPLLRLCDTKLTDH
jgi:hypothetical protein